jgi:hypothetical protein
LRELRGSLEIKLGQLAAENRCYPGITQSKGYIK